jgi:hypothetical protein
MHFLRQLISICWGDSQVTCAPSTAVLEKRKSPEAEPVVFGARACAALHARVRRKKRLEIEQLLLGVETEKGE